MAAVQVELQAHTVYFAQGLQEFAKSVDLTRTKRFVDDNFSYDGVISRRCLFAFALISLCVAQATFDNELHNSLDHASTYNDAWMNRSVFVD